MDGTERYSYLPIDTPELLQEHYTEIQKTWWQTVTDAKFDLVVVHAGQAQLFFEDDHGPTFKANPHFLQWIPPEYAVAESCLVICPGKTTRLLFFQPSDYWHAVPMPPDHLSGHLEIRAFTTVADLHQHCTEQVEQLTKAPERVAFVGEPSCKTLLGKDWQHNPSSLIHRLNFARAAKTNYELAAMRNASIMGALGHRAAANCFSEGGSEFDVHMAFLNASEQNEPELPYGNIVAQNHHAAFLHYQFQDRHTPTELNSLLIDAGGSYRGYASDITRTYVTAQSNAAHEAHAAFTSLLAEMRNHQDRLVNAVAPGGSYVELQQLMHEQLAEILTTHHILKCSAQEAFAHGLTEAFCPHGLGHLLGLQVHDVGGQQIAESGELRPPPENYPALRFTRPISENMVLTVEPGLYFIPVLLEPYRNNHASFNWHLIDALCPFGGIRIEDNVRVLPTGIENLTRDAFTTIGYTGAHP